jgi:hypothetical protein
MATLSSITGSDVLLSSAEQRVLEKFRKFQMTPGQMLCFSGPDLKRHKRTLKHLADKDLVVEEKFRGGYSLTQAGFAAMKDCT